MRRIHLTLLAGAMLGAVIATGGTAIAAPPPKVFSVVEGRDSATDRPVLVLIGKSLTKFKSYALTDPLGKRAAEVPQVLVRGPSMVVLGLASDLPAGAYQLAGNFGKADALTFSVKIGNGAPLPGAVSTASLDANLRSDLDDASTLGGQAVSSFRDASNVSAGTLDAARFSAYDDLAAEAKVGAAANQVAAGDHAHDARYPLRTELTAAGTLNTAGNPVDWTRLKGVPAGFADGVDGNTTYSAGAGLSLTGTTFSVANVGWTQLTGVPSGLADGVDNDTTYTPGAGLSLAGTTFSLAYAGTGVATTAARSDHNHNATYLALTGGSITGALNASTNAAGGASVFGTSSNASGYGVRGASTSPSGFSAGLYGTSSSTGGAGLWAEATATTGANYGVYATSDSISGVAVRADATSFASGAALGVFASTASSSGRGVYATSAGASSFGTYGETTNTAGSSTGAVGRVVSSSGTGVLGQATSTTGTTYGVWGQNVSSSGKAVYGQATGTTGTTYGVHGSAASGTGYGVYGENSATTGDAYAVAGRTASAGGVGVFGEATNTNAADYSYGVYGRAAALTGYGVYGETTSASFGSGVFGRSVGVGGIGVYGYNSAASGSAYGIYGACSSTSGFGAYCSGGTGVAGYSYFSGGVGVEATVTHASGTALIADNSGGGTGSIAIFRLSGNNKARIDYTGKGIFAGGTQTSGADFAESVAVAGPRAAYEAGDVIVIDTDADRSFALSKDAESALVAGVYSTKPGVLAMPHDCAGDDLSAMEKEIPLAVVGIVPVKVCDEGGPIARGDLLVTASLPGHAKKAPKDVKPGTLLGKSLGRLEKGTGRIEVYLAGR